MHHAAGEGPGLSSPSNQPLRLLLLEDNPHDAELILHKLQESHVLLSFKHVDNWGGFLRELSGFSPDIILSDFSLPHFTALDALRHLRSSGVQMPFILVTGSQSEDVAVQCMKEGADDYILKSSLQRLPRAVLNVVEKHAHRRKGEEAEASLHQQRDLYETLLTAQSEAGLGCAIISGRSQKLLYVNDAFCRIIGYGERELLALSSFFKVVSPDMVYVLEACLRRRIPSQNGPVTLEAGLIHKLGQRIEVEITIKRPRIDHETRFVVIIRDISERVRHENQLKDAMRAHRESEEKFRMLFKGVRDYAILMIDPTGRIVNWNTGAERMTGYPADEIIGKNHSLFYTIDDVQSGKPQRCLALARGTGKFEEEGWRVSKDKSWFWANVVISPLHNDERQLVGFSTVIRDLTERKRVDDQLLLQGEDLRALARHLQSVREEERIRIARELHDELGQVLTALRMDLSILSYRLTKSVGEAHRKPFMEKITSMSQLVEATIQSIRKIVSELRPTVLDEFGLMTAIQWQAQEFENRTGIRCIVSRLQRDVTVNPSQATSLFRILQEALTNVSRHAHANMVRISFEEKEGALVLTIKDNGRGFDESKVSRGKSFGVLGMQERARMQKGSLEIQGVTGEGTTVVARIPVQQPQS